MYIRNTIAVFALAGSLLAATAVDQARKEIAAKNYDHAIVLLEPAYKAKPSPDVKKALAEAYLGKADGYMGSDALPPRMKYPSALRAYREVLKYDKDNKDAQRGISTIEGIYKQMGRPIPQ